MRVVFIKGFIPVMSFNNFNTRWVDLLVQGPRPLVLEASGFKLLKLVSKKGGEDLTGKFKQAIKDLSLNTPC